MRKPTTIYGPVEEREAPPKSDWFAWIWRVAGGIIITLVATLGITLINQQNTAINNLNGENGKLNEKLGALRGELDGLKNQYETLRQFQIKANDGNKETLEKLRTQIQEAKEKCAVLEGQLKPPVVKPEKVEKTEKTTDKDKKMGA